MKTTRPTVVTSAAVLRALDDRTAGADDARQDRLVALAQIGSVRSALLERELERLSAKHGQDHPLVVATAERLKVAGASAHALGFEILRASLAPPKPAADAWTVFGIVCDPDGAPLPGVAVAVAGAKGNVLAPEKLVATGKDGAFSIVMTPPAPKARRTKAAAPDDLQAVDDGSVHLEVFRSESKRLAVDTVQFQPTLGRVDYREIVVASTTTKDIAERGS